MNHAAICPPAAVRHIASAIGQFDLKIAAAATDYDASVWESVVAPGEGPPMHIHTREDELFYVLEGTFRFWCGKESFVGGTGTTAMLPRNLPHTFRNIGEGNGRLLAVCTPGGFENFFIEVEEGRLTDPGAIAACAARYGLSFVPEQPAPANDHDDRWVDEMLSG